MAKAGYLFSALFCALLTLSAEGSAENRMVPAGTTSAIMADARTLDGNPAASGNSRSDTVDGVVFTVTVDKNDYSADDSIRVRYRIKNRSMGTVLYDFNTSCQFDLQLVNAKGKIIYSLLAVKRCLPDSTRLQLVPSAEKSVKFDPVYPGLRQSDSLTVRAQMAGYPLSAVKIKVHRRNDSNAASSPIALEDRAGSRPVLEFNHETKMLVIKVDRAQRVTISAFVLAGNLQNKYSTEKFLAPGTHLISFNNKKLGNGVVVFKVEGNGYSESKTINLSR